MIDYNQELLKFKPAENIEAGEDRLLDHDIKDIADIVEELVQMQEEFIRQ